MDSRQHQNNDMSRVEAKDCLIRDSQKIAGLNHTEKFTHGVESVVETLLPFHVFHRKTVLDQDYEYLSVQKGSGSREDTRSGHRRMLGCRNEIWEAQMLKKATRVRRRLGKLARRVKDLEGLAHGKASGICELVLHISDASVGEYAVQRRREEEAKRKAEEEKERRLAEKRAFEERMAQEEAARQARPASGSIKLKLSLPSSSKIAMPSTNPSSVSLPARTVSEDGTDAMDIAETRAGSESRGLSTDIGDHTSNQIKDSSMADVQSSSSSSSSEDDEDLGERDEAKETQTNVAASQAGKFKLYAMLNKKKQGQ